jgi:hypothetical protein
MNREEAKQLVHQEINQPDPARPDRPELVVLDEHTIDAEFGWVFFYTSRLHSETGDFHHALVGNAPYIVDRRTGELHVTGTAEPVEFYIERYQKTGDPYGELGTSVSLQGGKADVELMEAIKLLRRHTELNLVQAKRCIEDCLAGTTVQVEAVDCSAATDLALDLGALGFVVEVSAAKK